MASIDASTSGAGGIITTADNTGILNLQTASTTAVTIDASQNVGIGATSPYSATQDKLTVQKLQADTTRLVIDNQNSSASGKVSLGLYSSGASWNLSSGSTANNGASFTIDNGTERMRITSNGDLCVGKTAENDTTAGMRFTGSVNGRYTSLVRDGDAPLYINRLTNDGSLVSFAQANTIEGTISVSGTTVSYNGGHLSRWSQFYNETGKPSVYRGTVLESVDAMCKWEKDSEPLPNEQVTKTIVSNTPSSKAVAGVFDMYDNDDKDNPYDFYVAQSGDFVIRIAQGVTVQNGDLLESAGDGTAKPQADDICRSSTIAKVTSNYVSATYEDGSYCVPCILMIG
jgi:hypothetical protein